MKWVGWTILGMFAVAYLGLCAWADPQMPDWRAFSIWYDYPGAGDSDTVYINIQKGINRYSMIWGASTRATNLFRDQSASIKLGVYKSFLDSYDYSQGYGQSHGDSLFYHYCDSCMQELGDSIGGMVYHWQDATTMNLGGVLEYDAGDRCYVYYNNQSRMAMHYSTDNSRQCLAAWLKRVTDGYSPYTDQYGSLDLSDSTHFNFVWFDNALLGIDSKWGTVVSGGHVAEAGGIRCDSLDNTGEWWDNNMLPVQQVLNDTCENSENWTIDGSKVFFHMNVSGNIGTYWDTVSGGGTYGVFNEFWPDPIVSTRGDWQAMYLLDSSSSANSDNPLCAQWAPACDSMRGSYDTAYVELDSLIYNAWCAYLVTRSDSGMICIQKQNGPGNMGRTYWLDSLQWCDAMDTARVIGSFDSVKYEVVSSGSADVDGNTHNWELWKREYDSCVVYFMPKGDWNDKWGTYTQFDTVDLGGWYKILQTDGTWSDSTQEYIARMSFGAIMYPISRFDAEASTDGTRLHNAVGIKGSVKIQ